MIKIITTAKKICHFRVIFDNMLRFIENFKKASNDDVWGVLLAEGNHDLIRTLRRVEKKEGGYGTIVTPEEGFSKKSHTNELVLDWLKKQKVNVLDLQKEKEELRSALSTKKV